MTDAPIASEAASGAGAVAGRVFRTELNPVDFLRRAAYLYPEKIAVVDGERRYSYGQLAERSWRVANALRSAGLRKGERVATLLFNSAPMLEAHFGVPAAGGILVAINNRLAKPEVAYILKHSGARFLLLDAELESLVPPLAEITVIRCESGEAESPFERFLAAAPEDIPDSWLECAVIGDSSRALGGATQGVRHTQQRGERERRRDHCVLSRAARSLQVPRRNRVRTAAQNIHRQGPEIRPARARMG
jgi:non-ribosomal peptide synthetase component F